uniref:Uncharacterized protein n=1 Tax=Candidatus Kentrum sp. LPFa TaxID=2126335 RepID=A0A450VX43_9GAMM|nr:MAG: hypothetical protein BECKLPF1236B_GA0070989_10088 [Candidatus Kentron sp. LPFa]
MNMLHKWINSYKTSVLLYQHLVMLCRFEAKLCSRNLATIARTGCAKERGNSASNQSQRPHPPTYSFEVYTGERSHGTLEKNKADIIANQCQENPAGIPSVTDPFQADKNGTAMQRYAHTSQSEPSRE